MNQTKINSRAAGYLELEGAQKDGDCSVVEVEDGISREKGCCNNFWPPTARKFNCGECMYVTDSTESQQDEYRPIGKKEANKMSFAEILNSERPAEQ